MVIDQSVSERARRSGVEYVIRQTIEAYSREDVMPKEKRRNGFGEEKKRVGGGDKADQGEEGMNKCEREKATEGYF